MSQHVIGTYNLSFMSDLAAPAIGPGMQWASEGAFLARLYGKPDERRQYWINAINLLKRFLVEKAPSVVGLQEVNKTDGGATGSSAIDKILEGTAYKQEVCSVTTANGKVTAGCSIIYNPTKVGEVTLKKCFDNPNQGGRPILVIVTEKDGKHYVSVSIHGAQNPGLRLDKPAFDAYMVEKNKEMLETEVSKFLSENNVAKETIAGVFIMGDFNDRYDAIKEIEIAGLITKYDGEAPKSCCYNWDSSCPDTDVEKVFNENTGKYKTCKVPAVQTNATGKLTLDERGAIENYKYAGDKVFGLNPQSPMSMYRPAGTGEGGEGKISIESDHEFVYATVGEATNGGKRRGGKRHTKKRSHNKKHKTHRRRKSHRR